MSNTTIETLINENGLIISNNESQIVKVHPSEQQSLGRQRTPSIMDADLLQPEITKDAPRRSMHALVLPGVELYCGDCREILREISGDIVVTDPPYGLQYPYRSYDDTRENLATLLADVMPLIFAAAGRAVVMPGPTQIGLYPQPEWVGCVTWNTTGTYGKRGYSQWTPLLCYGPDVPGFGNVNGITKSDVLAISGGGGVGFMRDGEKDIHTCPKPLSMMKKVIQRHTMENEIVIDPFMGSGTTAIACVQMGRRFIGIEQDPEYFQSAVERIRAATAQGDMFLGQNSQFDQQKP